MSYGAKLRFVYLPHGEDGSKTGLDDYLAADHTLEDLLALATTELRRPPRQDSDLQGPYRETEHGLVLRQDTRDGPVDKPLTNFTARIMRSVLEDDGAETTLNFEIQTRCNGRERTFCVSARAFPVMTWPLENMGPGAVVYAGMGTKDHARAAIQVLSGEPPQERVFKHLGWRELEPGVHGYLHADGVIVGKGAQGTQATVRLDDPLSRYALPTPPEGQQLIDAVQTHLRLLDLAPDRITVPLLAAGYRAVLGGPDFSLHLVGPSGTFKTELAALGQQGFGAGMHSRNLPGSWSSTDNSLEALAFGAKDALLVIDDFAPGGSALDTQRLHAKAARVLRAQGNNSARQRMRPDGSLRPPKPPRSLIVSTGEDVPSGQSVRARAEILEVAAGHVKVQRLTACQQDAAAGLYAQAVAGFIGWVAPRYEQERQTLRDQVRQFRAQPLEGVRHRRTTEITANLGAGLTLFLRFAREVGVISGAQATQLWERGWAGLVEAEAQQSQHQLASEPAHRFIELLSAAIASGKAHVADLDGKQPPEARAWGWRSVTIGTGEYQRTEWHPQGDRIGWLDNRTTGTAELHELYLVPDASYNVARRLGNDGGEGLAVTPRTLHKRLHERGRLRSIDKARQTLTIRRMCEGAIRNVLHLDPACLMYVEPDKPDIPDNSDLAAPETAASGVDDDANVGFSVSGFSGEEQKPDNEKAQEPDISDAPTHGEDCDCRQCRVCRVPQPHNSRDYQEVQAHGPKGGNGSVVAPWEFCRDEFIADGKVGDKQLRATMHRTSVKMALENGLPVSTEVLADYPELSGTKTCWQASL